MPRSSFRFRVLAAVVVAALVAGISTLALSRAGRQIARRTLPESIGVDIRISDPRPDGRIVIAGEPELAAGLFLPAGPPRAAVLLIHGNRARGSEHPLYRLLGRKLSAAGCWVLALDLRGYGGSGAAPEGRPLRALDLLSDLGRGLESFVASAPTGVPRAVVGHSLGANLALLLAAGEQLPVVAIEPGLRLRERVVEPPAEALDLFTRKLARSVRGGLKDREVVRRLYAEIDPEATGRPVRDGSVLLLQGKRIASEDRLAIERIHAAWPGSELQLIASGDHEFGVVEIGGQVVYPSRLIGRLVGRLLGFLLSATEERPKERTT